MDPNPPSSNPHPSTTQQNQHPLVSLSNQSGWAVTTVTAQAELISAAILSLTSPSRFARTSAATLRRLAFVLLTLAYAAASLVLLTSLSFLLAAFLLRLWLENPLLLRRPLHLNYTKPQPDAVAALGGSRGRPIPSGHTVIVSLRLSMPESGFNRRVGIFQVSTAAVSSNGRVLQSSTRPCMLMYRSLPVRLMRTFAMAFPLLVGIRTETQQLGFEALRYGEGNSRTEAIRVSVTPRAGTMDLPQIYEAEMILRTRLPRRKEIVYNWKWSFYLWVSMNMFVLLLVLLLCCLGPFGFGSRSRVRDRGKGSEELGDSLGRWGRDRGAQTWPEVGEGEASNVAGDVSGEWSEDDGQVEASESSECVNA